MLVGPVSGQVDTTGGQFYQPLYPNVTITRSVAFGAAPTSQGSPQTLLLDVYQPTGGPAAPRPLIILAHGGAFLFGSRSDYDVSELCQRFARLGYVTASIDYRLESFFTFSGSRSVVNAVHDMRAAVRFFRQDAATTNQYNINPSYVFVGGSSAGAITAVHVAYLDTEAELAGLNAPGVAPGLEGNSGNPGYSSSIRAAINLCGAIGNLSWLQTGDEPLVSLHGTADVVVPYGTGPTFTGDVVNGSGAIKTRADAVNLPNTLYTFRGAGHVPYNGTSVTQQAYMDTTFRVVRNFLRPLLGQAVTPPLPVTLTRFTATRQGQNALLNWETASEHNSQGFEVQVSADGITYRVLGFVNSQEGGGTPRRYRFLDSETGKAGTRYYRLRQVDNDGTDALYGPRAVGFGASATSITAYPNPFSQETTVVIGGVLPAEPAQVYVHDALGRQVLELQLPNGASHVPLPQLAALPAGIYTLTYKGAGLILTSKLMKDRP
ncbi:hypothetical protein GCM10023186_23100 [Hymenobacter koreensis]|uniref:BD-FAE-like domain-containing protein n=1 Tax=Hymenobacter koreensis TaxID=1084523 RepID=A0ABP8J098_9BACT